MRAPPLNLRAPSAVALTLASIALVGCRGGGRGPSAPAGVVPSSITVTSTSFRSGGTLPVDFTCDGKNTLPSMTWSAPPPNTRALVLIVEDPDAPSGVFTHFIAFNLPADVPSIKEGADPTSLGALVGRNDFNGVQYDGPCPPKGEMHRYAFRLFALDTPLHLTEGASRAEVDAAMNAHVLGEGTASALFGH